MRKNWPEAAILAAALSLTSLVAADDQARTQSDPDLAQEVAERIHEDVVFGIFDDVTVRVEGAIVTLTGRVTAAFKAEHFARMAARVPGVQNVKNQLKPLPMSILDDGIRSAIAGAMHKDPVFSLYTTYPDPPIHVIVENGRVTLIGVVGSEVEKTKLEMIARSMLTVTDVQNELRRK
jgi:hyperosmotically inducible protein